MMWLTGNFATLIDPIYEGCGETIGQIGDVVKIAKSKRIEGPLTRIQVYLSLEYETQDVTHTAFAEDLITSNPTEIRAQGWT